MAVRGERKLRIVRNFPEMPVRIGEVSGIAPPQNTVCADRISVAPAAVARANARFTSEAEVQFQASDIPRKPLGFADAISASLASSAVGQSDRMTPAALKNATPSTPVALRRKPSAS